MKLWRVEAKVFGSSLRMWLESVTASIGWADDNTGSVREAERWRDKEKGLTGALVGIVLLSLNIFWSKK